MVESMTMMKMMINTAVDGRINNDVDDDDD